MKKNTIKRLLLFSLAIPGLFAYVILLPYYHHLSVSIMLVICSVIGTYEICKMMNHFGYNVNVKFFPLMGAILPIGAYLEVIGVLPPHFQPAVMTYMVIIGFIFPVLQNTTKEMGQAFRLLMAYLTAGLYPGFFISFIIRFAIFEESTIIIVIFMFLVFLNDSMAWLTGKLFGKTRNIVPASPNKSLAGFVGGIVTSIGVMMLAKFLYPQIFQVQYWVMIPAGFVFGLTTILGDLVESAIKRSVGVKDSGNIIMGRGGMLDSIDSLLITAPLYYFFLLTVSS